MNRLISLVTVTLLLGLIGLGVLTWAWWAPDQTVSQLKERWASAPSQFITVHGMQVHLRDEGPRNDPEPIVLLHGTSASLHTWHGWTAALTAPGPRARRVIRMDLPGFGLTGPHPKDDYSMDAYAAFVVALLDTLKVRRAVLAGNSLGGQVAWYTAALNPERVSRLVLVDASGYPFQSDAVPLAFRLSRIPVLRDLVHSVLPRALIERSLRSVYAQPDRVTPELIDQYFDMAVREGNRRALALRMQQRDTSKTALLATLKQPTLILWGAQDRLIPPQWADAFARDIPHAQRVVLDNLGHVPHEEDPARTVAEVQRFLAQ